MLFKIFNTFFFAFYLISAGAQAKQDYMWFFGNDWDLIEPLSQSYIFDFNCEQNNFLKEINIGLQFDNSTASICDQYGKLLFYSNGCAIANADHNIMLNGDSLNYTSWFDSFWSDSCDDGYPGHSITILEEPSNDDLYRIIHVPVHFNQDSTPSSFLNEIWYSIVDMNLDSGRGAVTVKNQPFFKGPELLWNYIATIRHSNKIDWWVIQPLAHTNRYIVFLLDENGLAIKGEYEYGEIFSNNASAAGNAKFSPDGKMYANYNNLDGLNLFDFDRTNGELSNLRSYKIDLPDDNNGLVASIEFSPNSHFLYAAVGSYLFQIDLRAQNFDDNTILIEKWDGVSDPFPTDFYLMALAPDCKIYMCSTSSTNTYHVINKPNLKGIFCDFKQRGIQLPYTSTRSSMPNFPRFRVDEAEVCDSTITSIFGNEILIRRDLELFPNPADYSVTIQIPTNYSAGELIIYNSTGQLIYRNLVLDSHFSHEVDVSNLKDGIYNVEFSPQDDSRRVYTNKFVKAK